MTDQDLTTVRDIVRDELARLGTNLIGRHPEYGVCPACIQKRAHTLSEWERYHAAA